MTVEDKRIDLGLSGLYYADLRQHRSTID